MKTIQINGLTVRIGRGLIEFSEERSEDELYFTLSAIEVAKKMPITNKIVRAGDVEFMINPMKLAYNTSVFSRERESVLKAIANNYPSRSWHDLGKLRSTFAQNTGFILDEGVTREMFCVKEWSAFASREHTDEELEWLAYNHMVILAEDPTSVFEVPERRRYMQAHERGIAKIRELQSALDVDKTKVCPWSFMESIL